MTPSSVHATARRQRRRGCPYHAPMTSTFKRAAKILGWILLLSGLLMSYEGCTRAGGGLATWLTGESADGVVTSIRTFPGSSPPARTRYRESSVITFRTAEGEVVTFEHPVQSSPPPFAKGERVRVFYDPDAPEDAVAPSGLALVVFGWSFLAVAGIVVMFTGTLLLVIAMLPWRERRSSRPGSP